MFRMFSKTVWLGYEVLFCIWNNQTFLHSSCPSIWHKNRKNGPSKAKFLFLIYVLCITSSFDPVEPCKVKFLSTLDSHVEPSLHIFKDLEHSKISKDIEESFTIFVNLEDIWRNVNINATDQKKLKILPKRQCRDKTVWKIISFTNNGPGGMNQLISWRLIKIPKIFKIYKDSPRSSKKSKDRRKFLTGAQKREWHVQLLSFLFVNMFRHFQK